MPASTKQRDNNSKSKKIIKIEKQSTVLAQINESMPKKTIYNAEELIFALDIGTRTVVGIVGIPENGKFKVLSAEVMEHKHRAMLDGQIHDIVRVAEVTKEIKDRLENKLGFSLTKVAIAAAGRVLRTCRVKVERDIEQGKEISQEIIGSLEIEGIQQAQFKLDSDISDDDKTQFYCVGYSIINYYLNGYVISSLLGHRGNKISVEILATFLPHIVVDSLYTVMDRVGLEVVSLTLEPIAAINVTIPKDLRLLNLALVDIGAGTSDIALTKDGSVTAYAMAPVAGDEITERIAQHYLVDFNTAEKMKISLSGKSEAITFADILGKKQSAAVAEVHEIIKSSVEYLAATISAKILEYNQKSPNAVFLIGGSSRIPGLTKLIAAHLKLPEDRVAVRGREVIQNIKFSGKKLSGPEAITPFGIAITAQMQMGKDFLAVTINGKKVRLFNSRKLTVADALILIGFNPGELICRTGKSISFELDGQKKIVRGEYGKAAEIFVNEKTASLETVLNIGDDIRVIPAEDGKDAEVRVGDFVKEINLFKIHYNSDTIDAGTNVLINGEEVNRDRKIQNGDAVQIRQIKFLGDIIERYNINKDKFTVLVNGKEVKEDYELKNMDIVECKAIELVNNEFGSGPKDNAFDKPYTKLCNEEYLTIAGDSSNKIDGDQTVSCGPSVIINGKTVIMRNDRKQHIFVDMFNYIDFDITKPQGNIVLKLNGKSAGFTDTIETGDSIEIYWEK